MRGKSRAPRQRTGAQSFTARRVVSQALRREHGYTSSSQSGQLTAYRETKIFQYLTRFSVSASESSTTTATLSEILQAIGNPVADVKVTSVKLWLAPKDPENSVRLRVIASGEGQQIKVTPRADKWVSGTIHPPQDDWFTPSGSFDIIVDNTGLTPRFYIDVSVRARLIIPETTLTPVPSLSSDQALQPAWAQSCEKEGWDH